MSEQSEAPVEHAGTEDAEFAPLAERMLKEAVEVLSVLPGGWDLLGPVLAASSASADELRPLIADAYDSALKSWFGNAANVGTLESSASRQGFSAADTPSIVSAAWEHADAAVKDFRSAKGRFAGEDPVCATPVQRSFWGWLQGLVRRACSAESRQQMRMRQLQEIVRVAAEQERRLDVAGDSTPAEVLQSFQRSSVIEVRRELLRAARRAIVTADVSSPDIGARRKREAKLALDIAREVGLRFIAELEQQDGTGKVTEASTTPDLVQGCLREVLENVLHGPTTDQLDQRVHRHRADALFAAAGALTIASVTGASEHEVDASAWDTARRSLREFCISLRLAQVEAVTFLIGRHVVSDISASRFRADLQWLDELLDWLATETAPSQRADAARPAVAWLEAPQKRNPSPVQQARSAVRDGTPKADAAIKLLHVWERLTKIMRENER